MTYAQSVHYSTVISHNYDHQCRCPSCTEQEIAWKKMSVASLKDAKKSRDKVGRG